MEDLFTRTLSPGELAQIVGVSQSSIRRWVDDGVIDVTRTTGGHRRILLYEALRFIREQGMPVLRPELLGVPELGSRASAERVGPLTGDVLFRLLQDGEAAKARGAIVGAFVDGMSLASLFDGPIARALAQIGTLWKHSEEGIFVEHVATGVCLEAVNRLRVLLPPPSSSAPVALGGAPSGDPYLLPSLMAATVVAGIGYRDVNLGPDTPTAAFLHAADVHRPALVWLTVTGHLGGDDVVRAVREIVVPLQARGARVVVGGQGAAVHREQWPADVAFLRSMEELETLATTHRAGAASSAS